MTLNDIRPFMTVQFGFKRPEVVAALTLAAQKGAVTVPENVNWLYLAGKLISEAKDVGLIEPITGERGHTYQFSAAHHHFDHLMSARASCAAIPRAAGRRA